MEEHCTTFVVGVIVAGSVGHCFFLDLLERIDWDEDLREEQVMSDWRNEKKLEESRNGEKHDHVRLVLPGGIFGWNVSDLGCAKGILDRVRMLV